MPRGAINYLRNESTSVISRNFTVVEDGNVTISIRTYSVETETESWGFELERTPNDDAWRNNQSSATEVDPGTYTGDLPSKDDADFLKLPVRQGDTVTLTLSKKSGVDIDADVNYPGGYDLLRNASATSITSKITVEENGFVYIEIRRTRFIYNTEFDWQLEIERTRGADKWRDSQSTATEVTFNESIVGNVTSPDDTDVVKIPVRRGDTVTPILAKNAGDDLLLDLEWPNGFTEVQDESATSLSHEITVEENGFVYVEIESDSIETGTEPWALGVNTEPSLGETNDPPTVTLSASASSVQPDQQVTLTADATDPDGDTLAYDWTQTAGPSVTLTDSSTATPEFTAPDISESTTLTFEIEVSDGNGNSVTETVSITVEPESTSSLPDGIARFDQGNDGNIGNLDVLQAVNAANNNEEIGGEPVSNLDILQLVNRATS
jgi:hypothetical protein